MEWLWTVLSPVFWLTSVLLNPWVAASLLGAATTAGLAFKRFNSTGKSTQSSRRKTPGVTVTTNPHDIIKSILQVFPIHSSNGWCLSRVVNYLRVFSRVWDAPSTPHTPHTQSSPFKVFASSVILECPPNKALMRAISHTDLPLWSENLSLPGPQLIRTSPDKDGDLIRLTLTKDETPPTWTYQSLGGVVPLVVDTVISAVGRVLGRDMMVSERMVSDIETISRSWYSKPGLHYIHCIPQDPSSLPYHWSVLMFTGVKEQKNICLATLVMLPRQQRQGDVTSLVANQLCALKEHVVMKNLKIYPSKLRQPQTVTPPIETQPPPTQPLTTPTSHPRQMTTPPEQQGQSSPRQGCPQRNMSEPALSPYTQRLDSDQSALTLIREIPSSNPLVSQSAPVDSRDTQYILMAKDKTDDLLRSAEATERDGWSVVGTKQNIHVMRLSSQGPVNCVKGTGMINAPPEFIMHALKDPAHTTQLDDMLKEARVVHNISDALQIIHMLYKGVWPTAPRDFAVLNISGQRNPQTWISSAVSVEDSRVPPEKGHVRGHLESGGYVIRAVPGNPNVSKVTYVAQVDLKGSIPSMVVNKIADSQPQCVNRLKKIVEPLYNQLSQNPQGLEEYGEKFKVFQIVADPPQQVTPEDNTRDLPDSSAVTSTQSQSDPISANSSSTPSKIKGHSNARSSLVANSNSGGTSFDKGLSNGFQTPSQSSDEETRVPRSPSVPIVPVAKETVPDDELQFQTPRFDDDITPHPMLLEKGGTDEILEAYTPEEIPSGDEGSGNVSVEIRDSGGGVSGEGCDSSRGVFVFSPSPQLELKLPQYPRPRSNSDEHTGSETSGSVQNWQTRSLTSETISYPRQGTGGVDFRTMANQTAARVLEEVFHVNGIDVFDPATFVDQSGGWKFSGLEKDVLMLSKKDPNSPFNCFIGKGVIDLPPQTVYDSIRNPQLRFTYDNMLKELHIVKQIEEGLYILHLHHETTQCFVKQSRDFCLLVSERSEPNKKLLTGTSIDVSECPPKPDVHRGRVLCSGWVVEPYRARGKLQTELTYLLQVDMGGVPSTLVNFISKRQPLAVAYLRDYLISTSLDLSHREDKDTTL